MMELPLFSRVLVQLGQGTGAWVAQFGELNDILRDEVVDVDLVDRGRDDPPKPLTEHRARRLDRAFEESCGVPADPGVPLLDLNDRAAESCDADHRMHGRRSIPNEHGHRAPRSARVLVRPSVPEVAPDILQPKPGELAAGILRHEAEVRVDDLSERFAASGFGEFASHSESGAEFPTISHEGEDRHEPVTMETLSFHVSDELGDRRLVELLVAFQQLLPSDALLLRLGIGAQLLRLANFHLLVAYADSPPMSRKITEHAGRGIQERAVLHPGAFDVGARGIERLRDRTAWHLIIQRPTLDPHEGRSAVDEHRGRSLLRRDGWSEADPSLAGCLAHPSPVQEGRQGVAPQLTLPFKLREHARVILSCL